MIRPALEIKTVQSFEEVEQLINSGWKIASKNNSIYGTDYLMTRKIQDYEFEFPSAESSSV